MVHIDQHNTPLVDALLHCATRQNAAFYTPGHKRGQGITDRHRRLFGDKAFRADLPELPELDNLSAPEGIILQAQELAAAAFGAEQTWFLANGSTCGIEAAILATCGPGDKLILPRNVHSSAISGLILSGAVPIYVQPSYSTQWDMPLEVSPSTIKAALAEHPDARAVLIVSPTYQGICSDLSAIAQLTRAHNIPLIIDEAHGPHFAFHPDLPESALSAGADIAVQSAHKVLSAFTQAAMLHVQGVGGASPSENRIDRTRLSQSLQITQSTSPSYLLLGSLDAARYQMATAGKELMSKTLEMSNRAYREIEKLSRLNICKSDDPTRLSVDVSPLGITGFDADEILHTKYSVTCELPALRTLTFIISLGNTAEDINRLIQGFTDLSSQYSSNHHSQQYPLTTHTPTPPRPHAPTLSPRQTFFAPKQPLPLQNAIGKTCAETITPYPPGIPLLLPGETITESAIAQLQTLKDAGSSITGNTDPTLQTILTVKP